MTQLRHHDKFTSLPWVLIMTLRQELKDEMKDGMRSRDSGRVSVIRLLFSTIKNKEIEKGVGSSLSDEEILKVIASAAKQRKESIEQFSNAGREELAEKERQELKVLQRFLPEPLSEEALQAKVAEAIAEAGASEMRQMGAVMKILVPQLTGRADGNVLRKLVQTALQGGE